MVLIYFYYHHFRKNLKVIKIKELKVMNNISKYVKHLQFN